MNKPSLAETNPEVLEFWNYKRNAILPTEVTPKSNKKVWWKCNMAVDHEWQTAIYQLTSGTRCPYCAGKRVTLSNCLATTHSHLVAEWYSENNSILPTEVSSGSHKKVWWKCQIFEDHVWEDHVNNRASKGYGCPYCAYKKLSSSNCLANTHPDLALEWDSERNKVLATEVISGGYQKFYWKCLNDPNHSWRSTISNRKSGSGCPICKESRGEKIVKIVLKNLNITYKTQVSFPGCKNIRPLRFDFAVHLPIHTTRVGLIEVQGEQHYRPVQYFGGNRKHQETVECDNIKIDFCKSKGIPLLTIPYWEFKNIEKMVENFVAY